MVRNVLIGLAIIAICIGGWYLYTRNNPDTSLGSGTVTLSDSTGSKENNTDLDGKPLGTVGPTPSRSDAPGTINGEPVAGSTTNQPPAAARTPAILTPAVQQGATANNLPTSDTIAPNPPNGLAFGGTGEFQWYRQGDLTWRVNTKSGSACIAFATMEQWQKPIVYTHGCGNS